MVVHVVANDFAGTPVEVAVLMTSRHRTGPRV
jgi:hypothetical protein